MNWVDVVWIGSIGASLTLGALHFFIWVRDRRAAAHLVFAIAAAAIVGIAWCELAMMRAQTVAQFAVALRWIYVPIFAIVLAIVVFLRLYFGMGRWWLAGAAVATRLVVLVVNFASPEGVTYRQLTALHPIEFLGQTVMVAEGQYNPWIWFGRLSSLLLFALAVDTAVAIRRQGGPDARRRAWTVAGSLGLFSLAATAHTALVQHGLIHSPFIISLFFLGAVIAMGAELTRDVVSTAELARQLHESEQRVALAAEIAELGVWDCDPRDGRVWATDRARSLFGLKASGDTTLGQLLGAVHPEDRDALRRGIERAAAGNGDFQLECRVTGPGDTVRWLANRGRVDAVAGSAVRWVRGVSVDITGRRQAETEARRNREEITHLARVALANELSGTLAHELNQPLGAILGNAQALQRLLARDPADLDEIRAIVEDIVADDRRAGSIIERVRQLIRKGEREWARLDVPAVVERALRLINRDLADRQITLTTDFEAGLPAVWGDGTQLQQVVLNLVMNAVDAMADTPAADRALRVGVARADGGQVRVCVSDTGQGISEQVFDRVFEHFVTTKPQGIGLGLPICRTIIEGHGGRLWAANNAGAGASVHFALPVEQGPPA